MLEGYHGEVHTSVSEGATARCTQVCLIGDTATAMYALAYLKGATARCTQAYLKGATTR
jgi:hypothetical protein